MSLLGTFGAAARFLLKLVVSVGLLVWLLRGIDGAQVGRMLVSLPLWCLIVAATLMLLQLPVLAYRWLRILNVDLLGTFYFTKQAFLHMKPGGAIVNVSSIHAIETSPLVAPYAAAKAAVLSLTRSSSLEGKAKGLRTNVVLPGAIDTPMLWENPNIKSGVEVINKADVGRPEDVAAVIAYLASDDAAFVLGAVVRVDGGRLDQL